MASPPTTLEATVREACPDHTRIPVRSRLRQAAAAFSIIAAPYLARGQPPVSRPDAADLIEQAFYEVFTPSSIINLNVSWVGPNPDYGIPGGYQPSDNVVQLSVISSYTRGDQVQVRPELGDCSVEPFGALLLNYDDQTPVFVTQGGDSLRLFQYLDRRYAEEGYLGLILEALPATDSPDSVRARAHDIFMMQTNCPVSATQATWGGMKVTYKDAYK